MNRQSNSRSPGQTRNVVVQKKQESNRKVDAQARVKSPLKRSGQGAQAGSKSPSNRQKSPSNDMRQQFNNMQKNKQVGRFSPKKNSEKSPKNIGKVSEKKLPQETPEEKLARLEQKKEGIVFLCRVAEQAENFEDLIEFLRQLVEAKLELDEKEFSTEEHNMISVGLRNYVGQLQSSIRVISALCQAKKYKKYGDVLPRFKVKMQLKLKNQIMEAVAFLSKSWKLCDDFKSQVLHQKLMGDHYRYAYEALNIEQYHELDEDIAKDQNNKMNSKEQSMSMEKSQIDNDLEKMKYYREPLVTNQELEQYKKEQQSFKDKAQKAYAFATVKAEKNLLSSNPYRLGLALNYTLFLYDVMGQKTDAKKMAKRAIEVANKKIEQIKDQMERQDAETIIELIEENLRQWQEDEEEEQEILNR